MNKEVKELIEEIKVFNIEHSHHPYYLYTLDKKDVELLLDYINQLETKINTYENPEDMTLMFMWCDEKAKDKIKELKEKLNQLETNRDEAIDFIKKTQFDCGDFNCCGFGIWKDGRNELLEILERSVLMNKEELLYNEIYERTKDFGRTQFVRELMRLQRENKQLKEKVNHLEANWDELKGWLKANDIHYAEAIPFRETLNKMQELERGKE